MSHSHNVTDAVCPACRRMRRRSVVPAIVAAMMLLSGCTSADSGEENTGGEKIVRVPGDAETIGDAVSKVAEGGMVLVEPGTYHEQVVIDKPDVTIRGLDRNGVVIDGEAERAIGVLGIADGVRVHNLTTIRHKMAGVLISGVHKPDGSVDADAYSVEDNQAEFLQRYEVRNVTSSNNGLYGIYAFHAQHGTLIDNYTSGGADSGLYLGQCEDCDAVITNNVAERNAIGFENANASGSTSIVGNRFSGNRVGMTLTTDYQESFVPQRKNHVIANVITDNNQPDSPAQAEGGFGIGVGISGGQGNIIERNLIAGNSFSGAVLSGAEDVPAQGNQFVKNHFDGNGVDVSDVSVERTPSSGTCLSDNTLATTQPETLKEATCPQGTAAAPGVALTQEQAPAGVDYLDVTMPSDQPNMSGDLEALTEPLAETPSRPDTAALPVPEASLLAERVTP